ncbi:MULTISPECIES: M3 family metallopeptidase [unclassified Lentimonas]|uniref:M3 family metallopeptidase n=1 Tax=unclassified Lentimonas TaxID=2630993 RepID=UPI00132C44D4|nr:MULTISPECIES: M3 family metallopeptidase [unclassified Lentimonas]CAA6679996.1 Oligopeptidase A (EC [Lentimonas sp. CC4]CAA6686552.1 Oligopeptidase A (EC [Lentimonas sp. CC6]CAA7074828.1 Oligopeptidase A (EC [Lentimonas sp. CC4]CAA7169455.1 Oligopeptidase A (EC [Lentimonas sp. CC21]CAA7180154.1 Oligopeptidase A (EC [Lentimonas sp. CC8]
MHPFLQKDFHIRWSTLTPDHIETDISKALTDAQAAVDAVAARSTDAPETLTYENTIAALDDGLEPLNHAWGLVSHLDSVNNSPELRDAHNAMLPKVSEFFAGIPLNETLWKTLKAYGESLATDKLSPTKQRYIHETLADFREQGADLPPEQKARAGEVQKRLAELTQSYSEHCLDATNAWEKIVTDEAELAGLPESAVAAAKQNAEQKGHENAWRFTLQAPSFIPVLTYADSDSLRQELWQAYATIGREGEYDNRELVREILDLRHEFAQIVGQDNFADHVTSRRMAASGDAALKFGNAIFNKIQDQFVEETNALSQFKADATKEPRELLEPWEVGYWAEKQRLANFDFDEEALRPYFPINRVISGMFDIAQQIFGLRIEERATAGGTASAPSAEPKSQSSALSSQASEALPEVWHEEVKFYDLFDADSGEQLGSFYADWHPRESKRGGAWMNYLLTGNRDASVGPRTPHLGLICGNLTPPVGDQPALLNHREVETIFHEFGHLLHHLCGEVEVKSLNGVNVPWDFVELPSQILENWCWDRESLDLFARHHETGDAIPQDLFDKMLAARNYMKASANVRQLSFGKMDLELHINWPETKKKDLDAFIKKQLDGYNAARKTEPKSNVFNFSHLFSSPTGYAAGYYSYKWAEVLDADAFTRFQKEGILNAETGRAFRNEILAKGNSEDPALLFKNFMHRNPDPDALLRRDGLID